MYDSQALPWLRNRATNYWPESASGGGSVTARVFTIAVSADIGGGAWKSTTAWLGGLRGWGAWTGWRDRWWVARGVGPLVASDGATGSGARSGDI